MKLQRHGVIIDVREGTDSARYQRLGWRIVEPVLTEESKPKKKKKSEPELILPEKSVEEPQDAEGSDTDAYADVVDAE